MKTAKCISCGNGFRVQDWKVGEERTTCHSCLFIEKTMRVMRDVLNQTLKKRHKQGKIQIIWIKDKEAE